MMILFFCGTFGAPGLAQDSEPNVLLLKLTPQALAQLNIQRVNGIIQTGIASLDALGERFGLKEMERAFRPAGAHEGRRRQFGLHRYYRFTFENMPDLSLLREQYARDGNTEVVQLSRRYVLYGDRNAGKRINFTPNDPQFSNQWHYHNTGQTGGTPDADIDAPEAWDIETGNPSVIVSDLDTGQDLDHPDLAANIWTNPGEIPGNGIDDDGNGYIDDVHGWDFSNNDNNPDDYDGHGTHTAGTVAAVTNNGIGVAGVAFNTKIMPCKIFPNAFDNIIAEAFTYAADNGSIISTNSWSYSAPGPPSSILEDAIDYFLATSNGVVVFAAGNYNTTDPTWGYPASYPPVIAVAATNHGDLRASFSNYGSWVDVSAPGVNVLSTLIGGYGSLSGTSMACPHVAGVAALVFAANPGFTGAQVRSVIEGSADNIDGLNPGFVGLLGTGRVNAYKALAEGPFPNPPENLIANNVAGNDVQLDWDDPTTNTDGSPIDLAYLTVYRNGSEIAQVGPGVKTYTDAGLSDGSYDYYVTATTAGGEESSSSNVAGVLVGNIDALIWLHPDVVEPNIAGKAQERGITELEVQDLLREPASHLALQAALAANGKSSAVVTDIANLDLAQFEAVFAVLGIYPNNHVVQANGAEALALVEYITGGGKVYLEGGDVWYWDPAFAGGHDFGPLFGIDGLEDGGADLATVNGVAGTFTEGLNFAYNGQNNFIDRLAPISTAFTVHRNPSPAYNCGVAYDPTTYKTIGNAFEFGGLTDGASTKNDLMAEYIDFLDLPAGQVDAVIWIPPDVLAPNLSEKAAQRGFTLQQVQTLKVEITSHEELAEALQANGKTYEIVNNLTEADLANAQYLFAVLGIYPNNHVIRNTDPERLIITNFLANNGKVYMEGGDVWYFDPLHLEGYDFGPAFGIVAEEDGINDLKTVYASCAVEELDFVYKGVNNFIDHISPAAGACLFHSNFAPVYGCGVGYAAENGSRTIGNTFQFGGLDDNSLSTATKTELMAEYLAFLRGPVSCQISVVSPNGGELLVTGESHTIQWTALGASGEFKLEFSSDGGASYSLITVTSNPNSYAWTVPGTLSNNCLIRISDNANPGCSDESDDAFAIVDDTDWEVPISVNAIASFTNELPDIMNFDLAFGGHPSATDGYDPGLDEVAPPPGFNYYAYFSIAPPIRYLSTDIHGWVEPYEANIDWSLVILNADGITSEICWDNSKLPAQGGFRLKGPGLDVDMRTQSCAQFVGNGILTIEYRFAPCVIFDFPVVGGAWYLISLPVIPEDNALNVLFPGAVAAFEWNYANQNYAPASVIEPGKGYWLLMLETATVTVCGQRFDFYTKDYTTQGWDLIGSVFDASPLVDNPEDAVLAVYRWNPVTGQYVPVPPPHILEPNQGYWVLIFEVPSSITVGGAGASNLSKVGSRGDLSAFYQQFGAQPPAPPFAFTGKADAVLPPSSYGLSQNFPNPFNPETRIAYQLPEAGAVKLTIYNMLGQAVRALVDAEKGAGYYDVIWDGRDDAGQVLPAGVYLYRLETEVFAQTRKVLLLK